MLRQVADGVLVHQSELLENNTVVVGGRDGVLLIDPGIPGHGSIGGADQTRQRIDQDRAYVHALRDAAAISDPRIGPLARDCWEGVADVHEGQLQGLAQRSEREGTPH